MGYVTGMSYGYSQFCVKADAMSLLDIELNDGGEVKKIEDLAYVILHNKEGDDDKIDLVPRRDSSDIEILSAGVAESYPEFIQSIETEETDDDVAFKSQITADVQSQYGIEVPEAEKQYYLRLTMPEVDDERKKVLDEAVKLIHDATVTRMDATLAFFTATITSKLVGEDEMAVKEVKQKIEDLKKQYEEMREKLTDEKKQQIEEGNRRYHENHDDGLSDSISEKMKLNSLKME